MRRAILSTVTGLAVAMLCACTSLNSKVDLEATGMTALFTAGIVVGALALLVIDASSREIARRPSATRRCETR